MNIVSTHSEFRGGLSDFGKLANRGVGKIKNLEGGGCSFSQITFFKGNPNSQSLLN